MTWSTGLSQEPYGELQAIYSPMGYRRTVQYASNPSVDFGLPLSVTGDSISQVDGSTRTPQAQFQYDQHGNVVCSKALNDSSNPNNGWAARTFDALGRMLTASDPDDASQQVCGRTGTLAGTHIVTTNTYYPNGQLSSSQTPAEYAKGVSSQFTYDADGNEISETHHFGDVPGTTTKWYDGADRLIEVALPAASSDVDSCGWRTRYKYDLTAGGSVGIAGSPTFRGYGNLFATQTYLCDTLWTDTGASAFDGLDRVTTGEIRKAIVFDLFFRQFSLIPGVNPDFKTRVDVHYEFVYRVFVTTAPPSAWPYMGNISVGTYFRTQ